MTTSASGYEEVLEFWFGSLNEHGRADAAHSKRWWTKDPDFDRSIRERFGQLRQSVLADEHEDWLATPRGRLAYVIVLDQFSRNLFRGNAEAFSADARALEAATDGIARGDDRKLGTDERSFFYMPLMHSEDLAAQDRCIALFSALKDELPPEERDAAAFSLSYAEKHRDIVRRFRRFPHRNAALGRTSTGEEVEFLKQPGSSF